MSLLSDYCLTPNELVFSYIIARTIKLLFNEMMMMSALY